MSRHAYQTTARYKSIDLHDFESTNIFQSKRLSDAESSSEIKIKEANETTNMKKLQLQYQSHSPDEKTSINKKELLIKKNNLLPSGSIDQRSAFSKALGPWFTT